MLYLDGPATRSALPMSDAITAMEEAFLGDHETPLRTLVGSSLVMPGRLGDNTAVKVVSTVPGSPAGIVVLFGPDGSPTGIVDGPTLTSIRTGAVCGLASRLLASQDARVMTMLGAGAMAFDQVAAIREVRHIEEVLVWSRDPETASRLAERVGGVVVVDADEAVAKGDIVSCATPSRAPLFNASAARPGVHLNAVGAFTPEMVELPPELVAAAFTVVDDYEAAAAEAGDLIQARKLPDLSLRELLTGKLPDLAGRTTVFKSVGVASQDVASALKAISNARAQGLGQELG